MGGWEGAAWVGLSARFVVPLLFSYLNEMTHNFPALFMKTMTRNSPAYFKKIKLSLALLSNR